MFGNMAHGRARLVRAALLEVDAKAVYKKRCLTCRVRCGRVEPGTVAPESREVDQLSSARSGAEDSRCPHGDQHRQGRAGA